MIKNDNFQGQGQGRVARGTGGERSGTGTLRGLLSASSLLQRGRQRQTDQASSEQGQDLTDMAVVVSRRPMAAEHSDQTSHPSAAPGPDGLQNRASRSRAMTSSSATESRRSAAAGAEFRTIAIAAIGTRVTPHGTSRAASAARDGGVPPHGRGRHGRRSGAVRARCRRRRADERRAALRAHV